MTFISKTILAVLLLALIATGKVTGRSTDFQIAPDIEANAREALTSLLEAYNRGDGAAAYEYLDTSVERSVMIDGYRIAPIPMLNLSAYSYDLDTVNIAYDLPHPGDILAAIQEGGDNPNTVRKNIARLRYGDDLTRRFETWHIVRSGDGIKFYFNNNGILRLSAVLGGQVDYYCNESDKHDLEIASFPGVPLSNRMVIMLFTFFECYEIEITSVEGKRILKEIARKIKTIPETTPRTTPQPTPQKSPKTTSRTNLKEVSTPEIVMRVPTSWINQAEELKKTGSEGLAYAFDGDDGESLLVCFSKEVDTKASSELRNKTDQEILTLITFVNRSKLVGELVDSGETTIGGAPSTYFLEHVNAREGGKRLLTYLFVENGVVYSLKFACYVEQYDPNYDLFMDIKDSLQFRHGY